MSSSFEHRRDCDVYYPVKWRGDKPPSYKTIANENAQKCSEECLGDPACTAFSLHNSECSLHQGKFSINPKIRIQDIDASDADSGVIGFCDARSKYKGITPEISSSKVSFVKRCHMHTNQSLKNYQRSIVLDKNREECILHCTEDESCNAFTYSDQTSCEIFKNVPWRNFSLSDELLSRDNMLLGLCIHEQHDSPELSKINVS